MLPNLSKPQVSLLLKVISESSDSSEQFFLSQLIQNSLNLSNLN
jgi:hypothetical protein